MTDTERERINAICEVAGVTEIDDLSDGFHTFRQLYYQRMMLLAAIVRQNKDKAWKSLRHEDGELCFGGGWVIVGIDTPEGSYTYYYENKYFDLFDCEILDYSKHWDGHTEKDVTRLLSLPKAQLSCEGTTKGTTSDTISRQAAIDAIEKNACNTQRIMDAVNNLPSAQLEESTEKRTEMHACDLISRQAAIDALKAQLSCEGTTDAIYRKDAIEVAKAFWYKPDIAQALAELPPAQLPPISEAYAKAVRSWLVNYQVKLSELDGRYTPYEVLGWVVSDWRKENGIW